jgi:hypothetical protein
MPDLGEIGSQHGSESSGQSGQSGRRPVPPVPKAVPEDEQGYEESGSDEGEEDLELVRAWSMLSTVYIYDVKCKRVKL